MGGTGWRKRGRFGWRMLKMIWGLYRHILVDTGVGTGSAGGGEAGYG